MCGKRMKKKIKVSHTIDEKYIKLIENDVDNKRFGSRSHAINYALKLLFENNIKKKKSD